MGHSLADVDLPCFQEIVKNIDAKAVKWKVGYHRDRSAIQAQMLKLNIDPDLVSLAKLDDF